MTEPLGLIRLPLLKGIHEDLFTHLFKGFAYIDVCLGGSLEVEG